MLSPLLLLLCLSSAVLSVLALALTVIAAAAAAVVFMQTGAVFNGPPTRILVLRNMVGPGEVDEELEEEVRV